MRYITQKLRIIFSPINGAVSHIVPPTGYTARLTLFSCAVMSFLVVFALALSSASGRLAARWSNELSQNATIRISAPAQDRAAQIAATLQLLQTTPGVASARALTDQEHLALLEPWFEISALLPDLPIPQLIDITIEPDVFDPADLSNRLSAEIPQAVFDDHAKWRTPLLKAASRLRYLGWLTMGLIFSAVTAMIALAAHSALSANAQTISVLRLIGATDGYIIRAFTHRFGLRAFVGSAGGTALGVGAMMFLSQTRPRETLLTGVQLSIWGWVAVCCVPVVCMLIAIWTTRLTAYRMLRGSL